MVWEELSPEDTKSFIDQVRDEALENIFDYKFCKVFQRPYPFYKNGILLTLENHSVAPPFTLEYFQSGDTVVFMDGGMEPFHLLNQNGCLRINEENVVDYLEFYCKFVNQRPKNILLLRNPDDLPYQDTVYIDFHFDKNNYGEKDIKVQRNIHDNGYDIAAPFVFAGKIDPGIAQVSDNGNVEIRREFER